ncbi:hypothetical protein BKA93DRAFT_21072 [Sparassis latifolia]
MWGLRSRCTRILYIVSIIVRMHTKTYAGTKELATLLQEMPQEECTEPPTRRPTREKLGKQKRQQPLGMSSHEQHGEELAVSPHEERKRMLTAKICSVDGVGKLGQGLGNGLLANLVCGQEGPGVKLTIHPHA